jgi:H+-transporting ATPase
MATSPSCPRETLCPVISVRARSGDFVPADLKVIEGDTEVDQSALTGESLPVEKKAGDILYSGSLVRKGEATGIIILTGTRTYFGRYVLLELEENEVDTGNARGTCCPPIKRLALL